MGIKNTRSRDVNRIIKALAQNQPTLLTPILGDATATTLVVSTSETVASGVVVTDNNQVFYDGDAVSYNEEAVYYV